MNDLDALVSYDPYDVWATPLFGRLKMDYNNGRLASRPLLACCYLADFVFPQAVRSILKCPQTLSPHVLAMHALMENDHMSTAERSAVLDRFASMNVLESGFGWGLPFRWYSKHAVYSDRIPYITHTPYVMEALLELAADDQIAERAMDMFRGTWELVSALRVMAEGNGATALSYSPAEEGRIVNNAQSYAAFACALHSAHGDPNHREEAVDLCHRLVNWILHEQRPDGSWLYYADDAPGNFMDCFHTCFIIKNVSKVMTLVPEISETAAGAIRKAIDFLDVSFLDRKRNLCRRFVYRVRHDPYRWDIYDQAEYLGVLIDQERLDEAVEFRENSRRIFSNGKDWWCRIDWFGRRWGRNFLRWGIMPFKYHSARLDRVIRGGE